MDNQKTHYVVATGIIVKDGKYLIAKRASFEKAFPNRWTVPGGKLESKEFTQRPHDAGTQWYNVIEDLVEREIKEETDLEVKNIGYVTSLAYMRSDGIPTIIISLCADYKTGEIKLCNALTEYAWVTLEEARNYDLIEGIYEELAILDHYRRTGKQTKWEPHLSAR
ncbi:MAG: NUDIX domain-containing protein [Candidatus Iainarchaeum archaeon]|uniref:NUDIX domain-containing protein n=1 Tax=Candidatus Iainarchaeum sp. TaxID=3101447 RepID=A0A7T9I0Y1_9ARCH|nr:MAG: NUDIX domain-containing protein [Candidatus Diapherotrites archaeon]